MTHPHVRITSSLMILTLLLLTADLAAEPLELGEVTEGVTHDQEPAEYLVAFKEAGILTVAARAEQDIVLKVVDGFHQPVLNGMSDMDLGGEMGNEQIAATIAQPGAYRIVVEPYDLQADYTVVASFVAFPDVAAEAPEAGTPEDAHELEIGGKHSSDLAPADGKLQNWYRVQAPGKGELTIDTRGDEEGDLTLEIYKPGAYREAIDRSDQDLQDNWTHEEIVLDVEPGEVYFVRVATPFQHWPVRHYTIRASFEADARAVADAS